MDQALVCRAPMSGLLSSRAVTCCRLLCLPVSKSHLKKPKQIKCIDNIIFSCQGHRREVVVCDTNGKGNIGKIVELLEKMLVPF